jgi:tetratricopeptide (TPR) repeat protein
MTLSRFFSACSLALVLSVLMAGVARGEPLQDISKLVKQGQHAQALDQVDKYLAGKPKDPQGRFLKGLILTEMNKPNDAAAVFQKLTEDYPELPEPYNNLAVIYAQQKQFDKAKQALEMAIRTHPSYATAHENLGDIYTRMASQAYDKALQIDSSNTSAQTKLSMIRDLMGNNVRPGQAAAPAKPATVVAALEPKPLPAKPAEPAKAVEAAKPAEPAKPVEAAKPVESAVPAKAPAKPATSDASAEVAKAVESWAAAWSKKDVKGYLAHYARDFKTPDGLPRAKWETERTQRINKPGAIAVDVDNLRVTMDGADHATARFRQHYKSASFKTSSNKSLLLVRHEGKWRIQQERVGN